MNVVRSMVRSASCAFIACLSMIAQAGVLISTDLANDERVQRYAVSDDGNWALYTTIQTNVTGNKLFLVNLIDGTPTQLGAQYIRIQEFVFSSDSNWVLFDGRLSISAAASELRAVSVANGASTKLSGNLALDGNENSLSFLISPDSTQVVFKAVESGDTAELFNVSILGGTPVKLNSPLMDTGNNAIRSFALGPNNSRVVYSAKQDTTQNELYSVSISGGASVRLNDPLQSLGSIQSFHISPDGNNVVYIADASVDQREDAFSVPIDGGNVNSLGEAFGISGNTRSVVFLPDSSRVLFTQDLSPVREPGLISVGIDGSDRLVLSNTVRADTEVRSFALAPDGIRAYYAANEQEAGIFNISSVLATGGGRFQINPQLGLLQGLGNPVVSPDSNWITYQGDQDTLDDDGLYLAASSGSATERIANGNGVSSFTPDSQRIVFEERDSISSSSDLFIRDTDGGPRTVLVDLLNANAFLHNDWQITKTGAHLIYRSDERSPGQSPRASGLYVQSLIDIEAVISDTIGFEPNEAVTVVVTLSQAPGDDVVSLFYETSDGTAQAGSDFTAASGTLTFTGTQQTTSINIALVNDTFVEGEESFTITLSNPSGAVIKSGTATVRIRDELPVPRPVMAASVLPSSRTVLVGEPATAFATVINISGERVFGCRIAPITAITADFFYQTTDPLTNGLIGTPNTPVAIDVDELQSFVFAFTPTAAFDPTLIQLDFSCVDASFATVIPGLNSFQLAASETPVPDIIALTTTVDLPVTINETALFAVASANVGSIGEITVSADTGNNGLPIALSVCETDPQLGSCSGPVATSTTTTFPAGSTPTFAIFATATGNIANDPANNRIFIRFRDAMGLERGSTSTSVRTE